MNIQPLGDKLLIKIIKEENITPGGIIMPGNQRESSKKGKVVSVGPNCLNDLKEGDVVFFGNHVGAQVSSSDGELLVMRECFILGVLECQ